MRCHVVKSILLAGLLSCLHVVMVFAALSPDDLDQFVKDDVVFVLGQSGIVIECVNRKQECEVSVWMKSGPNAFENKIVEMSALKKMSFNKNPTPVNQMNQKEKDEFKWMWNLYDFFLVENSKGKPAALDKLKIIDAYIGHIYGQSKFSWLYFLWKSRL